jgi:hypothetical protein
MQGVITKKEVLAHPLVVLEGFGVRVLVRALTCGRDETFLDVVNRCAEEDQHRAMADVDLARTVEAFLSFEARARDLYRALAGGLAGAPEAARFLETLAGHEEGHAVVLARVRCELRRGRCWKASAQGHQEAVAAMGALLSAFEAEARGPVTLERALAIVEAVEGSELNVVFDTLRHGVDMRSRARFESLFVLTDRHLAFCAEGVRRLRGGS